MQVEKLKGMLVNDITGLQTLLDKRFQVETYNRRYEAWKRKFCWNSGKGGNNPNVYQQRQREGGKEGGKKEREGRKDNQWYKITTRKTAESILTLQSKIYKSAIKKPFFLSERKVSIFSHNISACSLHDWFQP